jgi:hydroxyacylglutathione hydrolase
MPPMRLTDGVYKVDGVRVANVYLVAIDDGLLLVDTGMPGNAKRIVAFIESIGRHAADLRYIILTHCDLDHIGSVAALKELTGARVAIHELDGAVLAGEQRPQSEHVPGYTAGSIVLSREDGVVFSGDALLSDQHGQIRPPDPRLALDRAQALASAELIKAPPISLLCTGHGAPVHA